MLELRRKEVAREQIVTKPVDPRKAGEQMIGWVTPYQRSFAKYPLTLHAKDTPPQAVRERAKLAARVDEILSYAPALLPSHRDHPQWNYHLAPFMQARHQYLSEKLSRATELDAPPANLMPIDRFWWRLDGTRKRHQHRRDNLVRARDEHMDSVETSIKHTSEAAQEKRESLLSHFVEQFTAARQISEPNNAPEDDLPGAPFFTRVLATGSNLALVNMADLPAQIIDRHRAELISIQANLGDTIKQLSAAKHAVYLDYQAQLSRYDQVADAEIAALERSYAKLIKTGVKSAAIPRVQLQRDLHRSADQSQVRDIVGGPFNRFWRRLRLLAYQSNLRHVRKVIANVISKEPCNILVITGELNVIDSVIPNAPGVRAAVPALGVQSGNLRFALDPMLKFDLCLWELSAIELANFQDCIEAVRFCMKSGATIVGFHENDRGIRLRMPFLEPTRDPAVEVFVDEFPRPVAIINRSRRTIAGRGLLRALSLYLRHLRSMRATRFPPTEALNAGALQTRVSPTAVTIIARVTGITYSAESTTFAYSTRTAGGADRRLPESVASGGIASSM